MEEAGRAGKTSYVVWIWLLMKRLLRQKAFLGLLLSIPVLGYAAARLEGQESAGFAAAVCVEEGGWSEELESALEDSNVREDSIVRYTLCGTKEEVVRLVAGGKADCGFWLPSDIEERVMNGRWQQSVTVYETGGSSMTQIAKERVAGVLFGLYSERMYEDCMRGYAGESAAELVRFAKEAYQNHLVNGSVFSFRYMTETVDSEKMHAAAENMAAAESDNAPVFPAEGIFAVLIFVSGMAGMLEYEQDKKEKRFLRIAPNWLTFIVNIWIPTLFTSLAALVSLWTLDMVRCRAQNPALPVWSLGMWAGQIVKLLYYQFIILLYCCMMKVVLRSREAVAAAMPIMTAGCLICSPVFIRLAAYVPLFGVLEWLFPATYYLA